MMTHDELKGIIKDALKYDTKVITITNLPNALEIHKSFVVGAPVGSWGPKGTEYARWVFSGVSTALLWCFDFSPSSTLRS
eukprot:scaffold111050_cov43-Tisochrysis_lutea.AAC.2